ncbi:MAG TPA: M15 family metallopeptidase, partial [Candidatus Gracilibacteria bacterium]|nr:M15 family metallopeptidase [Candidatus Gracilibacteria bacterium]
KNREHMKGFYESIQKQSVQERQDFNEQLDDWYQAADKASMRKGGISEDENDPTKSKDGYLKRHAKLSSAFVSWDKQGNRPGGLVGFGGNGTAEYKVGLGDLLPPNVKSVRVEKKGGEKVECVRVQNPHTGRIGYYEKDNLLNGNYLYVPVHSGDRFEVLRTMDPNDTKAQLLFLREHLAVYKQGAMDVDDGEEMYYDSRGVGLPDTPAGKHEAGQWRARGEAVQQRAGFQRVLEESGIHPPGRKEVHSAPRFAPGTGMDGGAVEINGKKYQRLTRQFLESKIGTTPEATSRWLVGTTFLGQKVSVSPLTLPYLKEAESRIRAAGINFKLKPSAGGCQCYNHRGIRRLDGSTGPVLSKHSWGIALDLNPGDHPFGVKWENNNNPNKIPIEMVKIMEDCGFRWGNTFGNADPMHFELNVNPFTSQDILRSQEGKQGLAVLENFAGGLGNDTRQAYAKAKEAPSRPAATQQVAHREAAPVTPGQPAHHVMSRSDAFRQLATTIAGDHRANAEKMELDPGRKQMLDRFLRIFNQNKARYEKVGKATDMPPELIAAIHNREGGMRFDTYLHNGQKLGKPTTFVPKGIFFREDQWEEAAIHALTSAKQIKNTLGIHYDTTDMGKLLAFAESYNGFGYRPRENTPSPYIYAGTNMDTKKGRYVADGRFSATSEDKGVGVAAMLKGAHDQAGPQVPTKEGERFVGVYFRSYTANR